MERGAIPDGFERHFRRSPLTDPWEPIYSRRGDDAVVIGLRLTAAHTNSRGFVHGGLIAALADNAMGLSCAATSADPISLVTISLAVDFVGSARTGQWLQIEPTVIKSGGSICFTQCLVTADGAVCARANATFKALRKS